MRIFASFFRHDDMKYRLLLLLASMAVSMLSGACGLDSTKGEEEGVAEVERPADYVEWDSQYWDSTNHYLLLVKWIGDTMIRFDYRVIDSLGNYRYVGDTAVNKYGWLACEFIESGDTLIPADEYLWEDSVSLGIRIGIQDDRYAVVLSDSKAWASPMLAKEDPMYL